jgi:predicted membrane channel-forming protein YqfA (hemolysin III family)
VVVVWMPRAPFLQQVLEAVGVLFQVLLRRALDSRDSVVWLALAVGTRVVVVVVATALVRVASAAAALVLLALATDGVVLGVGLVFFIRPGREPGGRYYRPSVGTTDKPVLLGF